MTVKVILLLALVLGVPDKTQDACVEPLLFAKLHGPIFSQSGKFGDDIYKVSPSSKSVAYTVVS